MPLDANVEEVLFSFRRHPAVLVLLSSLIMYDPLASLCGALAQDYLWRPSLSLAPNWIFGAVSGSE